MTVTLASPPATAARKCADSLATNVVRAMLFAPAIMHASHALTHRDVRHYFEYSASGVEVVSDGLQELRFGEFLVEQKLLDRQQLFRSMQMQDRHPGVRLGECAAALGYVSIHIVERAFRQFVGLNTVTVQ